MGTFMDTNERGKQTHAAWEFAHWDGREGALFAGTPGLVRLLQGTGNLSNKTLALLDVKGAFLNGMTL